MTQPLNGRRRRYSRPGEVNRPHRSRRVETTALLLSYAAAVAVRPLGDLEAQVMDRIWRRGRPVLVRDIVDDLNTDRSLAYTTVMTVMEKLHRKGWLRRESQGRAYLYEATATREAYTARLMRQAWATSDNQAVAFVHFLEQLSPEEAQALRTALDICPPDAIT